MKNIVNKILIALIVFSVVIVPIRYIALADDNDQLYPVIIKNETTEKDPVVGFKYKLTFVSDDDNKTMEIDLTEVSEKEIELPEGFYTLLEIECPEKYEKNTEEIKFFLPYHDQDGKQISPLTIRPKHFPIEEEEPEPSETETTPTTTEKPDPTPTETEPTPTTTERVPGIIKTFPVQTTPKIDPPKRRPPNWTGVVRTPEPRPTPGQVVVRPTPPNTPTPQQQDTTLKKWGWVPSTGENRSIVIPLTLLALAGLGVVLKKKI